MHTCTLTHTLTHTHTHTLTRIDRLPSFDGCASLAHTHYLQGWWGSKDEEAGIVWLQKVAHTHMRARTRLSTGSRDSMGVCARASVCTCVRACVWAGGRREAGPVLATASLAVSLCALQGPAVRKRRGEGGHEQEGKTAARKRAGHAQA